MHHGQLQLMTQLSHRARMKRRTRRRVVTTCLLLSLTLGSLLLFGASRANAAQASCFGPGLFGGPMANGQILYKTTVAIASPSLPLGTRLRVSYSGTVLTAIVKDRGPFVSGRTLDLTEALVRRFIGNSDHPCDAWGVRTVKTWRAQ